MRLLVICAGIASVMGFTAATANAPGPSLVNFCSPQPVRTDAMDHPSKHAWDLFLMISHPAKAKNIGRGQPDCSKRIGTPGTTAVWETWRNAGTEVYLSDGREPPEWSDISLPDERPGSVPEHPVDDAGNLIRSLHIFAKAPLPGHLHPMFAPEGVFNDAGGFGETRLNKVAYDFVRGECLFSKQGQQRYAKAVVEGKKPPILFPPDAIEVKAAWIDFDKEKIPPAKQNSYYTAHYKGKAYGLTALHILTKDIPNWFWATFHHKDEPANQFEVPNELSPPAVLSGTAWENYRLGGTQVDFVDPQGQPTRLSDYYVEFGFQRSSCMTCHATASISQSSSMPSAQPRALCSMTPNLPDAGLPLATCRKILGSEAFKAGTDELFAERGVPDFHWFEKEGNPYYLQTDFVWSIPFRANSEKTPPPARCIW